MESVVSPNADLLVITHADLLVITLRTGAMDLDSGFLNGWVITTIYILGTCTYRYYISIPVTVYVLAIRSIGSSLITERAVFVDATESYMISLLCANLISWHLEIVGITR